LQETQFLQPRQLTQLSLPSLSGMVVVPPWLLGKQWTSLEGRSAVDQILGPRDAVQRVLQAISRRRGFCTCDVISLDFGSCETVWRSGTCGHWMDVADRICISPHPDLFFDHPTFRSRSSGRLRDDSRWPCQQHRREWRMSSLNLDRPEELELYPYLDHSQRKEGHILLPLAVPRPH